MMWIEAVAVFEEGVILMMIIIIGDDDSYFNCIGEAAATLLKSQMCDAIRMGSKAATAAAEAAAEAAAIFEKDKIMMVVM